MDKDKAWIPILLILLKFGKWSLNKIVELVENFIEEVGYLSHPQGHITYFLPKYPLFPLFSTSYTLLVSSSDCSTNMWLYYGKTPFKFGDNPLFSQVDEGFDQMNDLRWSLYPAFKQ